MIELVAIGDEVLHGYTINSNASYIAKTVLEAGYLTSRHTVVGDDEIQVTKILSEALKRGSFVIVTGGLGPTCDDLTRKIVANLFKVPLKEPPGLRDRLTSLFGLSFPTIEDQVLQLDGAHLFVNRLGSASGFAMENEALFPNSCLVCLPGVPNELQALFSTEVLDFLKTKNLLKTALYSEPLHFHTLTESQVDPTLREIEKMNPQIRCGIYPGYSALTVHLECRSEKESIAPYKKLLLERFGAYHYASTTGALTEAVHELLLSSKITLSCAESCTGGALSASFVRYANASHYFQGAVVSYSNQSKEKLLQVAHKTIESFGAVSVEVTEEMATSIRRQLGTDCSIAVSGILGPTGATPGKPVGTMCATISLLDRPLYSWTMHFVGNRVALLEQTIQAIHAELYKLCLNGINR